MPLYLQTRSTHKDYDFLGKRPDESWWSSTYGRFTAFEDFTFLLEADPPGTWRAYMGGIPSGRLDRVGVSIRYTLAGAGILGDADARCLYTFPAFLLKDYTKSNLAIRLDTLGRETLDSLFPQSFMDGLGRDWYSPETYEEARGRLHKAADSLEHPFYETSPFSESQGAYMMEEDTARKLLGLVGVVLRAEQISKPIRLAVLNLSPDQEEVRSFWRQIPHGLSPLLFIGASLKPGNSKKNLLFVLEEKGSRSGVSKKCKFSPVKAAVSILLILILGILLSIGVGV